MMCFFRISESSGFFQWVLKSVSKWCYLDVMLAFWRSTVVHGQFLQVTQPVALWVRALGPPMMRVDPLGRYAKLAVPSHGEKLAFWSTWSLRFF